MNLVEMLVNAISLYREIMTTAKPWHALILRLFWIQWELEPFCDRIRHNRRIGRAQGFQYSGPTLNVA